MPPQPQEFIFNMDLCRACEEKRICHTATANKKQAENKTEPHSQPFLWQTQNKNHHIKRKTQKPTQTKNKATKPRRVPAFRQIIKVLITPKTQYTIGVLICLILMKNLKNKNR
jgi:hypothetical protein